MENSKILNIQPPYLPQQTSQKAGLKTLVLDLDETLVHSSLYKLEINSYILQINFKSNVQTIYVAERPFLKLFMSAMSDYYEIVIFTSAIQEYAEAVINQIDPKKQWIQHSLFRQHCVLENDTYTKDLRQLGRNMNEILIIDVTLNFRNYLSPQTKFNLTQNSYDSYQLTPENGFLITSFFDDRKDQELYDLIPFFLQISELDDVREVEDWKDKYDQLLMEEMNERTIQEFGKNELPQIEEETYPTMTSAGIIDNEKLNDTKENYISQEIEQDLIVNKQKSAQELIILVDDFILKKEQSTPKIKFLSKKKKSKTLKGICFTKSQQSVKIEKKFEKIQKKTQSFVYISKEKIGSSRFQTNDSNLFSPLKEQKYQGGSSQYIFA